MRLNMNNHYRTQSVSTDIEGLTDDIELHIKKFSFKIARRVYYKITLRHKNNTSTILLNRYQLEEYSKNLSKYIEENMHTKRVDSKGSVLKAKI